MHKCPLVRTITLSHWRALMCSCVSMEGLSVTPQFEVEIVTFFLWLYASNPRVLQYIAHGHCKHCANLPMWYVIMKHISKWLHLWMLQWILDDICGSIVCRWMSCMWGQWHGGKMSTASEWHHQAQILVIYCTSAGRMLKRHMPWTRMRTWLRKTERRELHLDVMQW